MYRCGDCNNIFEEPELNDESYYEIVCEHQEKVFCYIYVCPACLSENINKIEEEE